MLHSLRAPLRPETCDHEAAAVLFGMVQANPSRNWFEEAASVCLYPLATNPEPLAYFFGGVLSIASPSFAESEAVPLLGWYLMKEVESSGSTYEDPVRDCVGQRHDFSRATMPGILEWRT